MCIHKAESERHRSIEHDIELATAVSRMLRPRCKESKRGVLCVVLSSFFWLPSGAGGVCCSDV